MEVRVQNEEMFEKRFLKAVKKAKLNYEFKEFYDDTITVKVGGEYIKIQRHFKIYEVEDLPASDWELVKRFDHENGVILSFGEEGHNELLNECKCEACGVNHKRVFTYLLRNKKNPLNFIQVGRSCLSKYIPTPPKFSYDDYLEFLNIDFEESDDVRGCGLTASDELPAKEILISAVAGFKHFKKDYNMFKTGYDFRFGVPCTENQRKEAEEDAEVLLDWILNHNPRNSEYLDNLYRIAERDFVVVRNIRIWQSAVTLLQRAKDFFRHMEENRSTYNNEPLKTGKNILTLKRHLKTSSSTYEVSYYRDVVTLKLHAVTDDNRYVVISMSNSETCEKIEKGLERGEVKVQVTVKDSNEFNGVLYNFANRAKILELPKEPEPETVNYSETESGKALDALLNEWDS